MKIETNEYITVSKAARKLNVSRQAILANYWAKKYLIRIDGKPFVHVNILKENRNWW